MEKGFTKEQLERKLKALKEFPTDMLNYIGQSDRTHAINRIGKKLKLLALTKEELFQLLLNKRAKSLKRDIDDIAIKNNTVIVNSNIEDCKYVEIDGIYSFVVVGTEGSEAWTFTKDSTNITINNTIKRLAKALDCRGLK